jgi:hypothetical protein
MLPSEYGRVGIPALFRWAPGIHLEREALVRIEDEGLHDTTWKRRLEWAQHLVLKQM